MGTWGTGISSNDVYEDINHEFFELYNEGLEIAEITDRLIRENKELIESHEDQNDFWLTIAKCQWECKALDPEVHIKVKDIVESGRDLELWEELEASKSDLTKRKKVLTDFLAKISVEKKTTRKRKKKTIRDAIFEKGDCLTFRLTDGDYSGAFVLEAEKGTEFGLNLIAIADIKKKEKPNLGDFEKAKVHFSMEEQVAFKNNKLITDFAPSAQIYWCHAQFYKKTQSEFEVVGNLKVAKSFDANKDYQRFSRWDNMVLQLDNFYSDFEKNYCDIDLKLKKLRKKYWL